MVRTGIIVTKYEVMRLLKIVKKLSSFSCVAVYDPEKCSGKTLTVSKNGYFPSYSDFLSEVDAIIVADSCSENLFTLVELALKNSKHVYIADPLCFQFKEAQRLLKLNDEIPSNLYIGNLSDIQSYERSLGKANVRWMNIRRTISEHENFGYVLKKCISQVNNVCKGEIKKADVLQVHFGHEHFESTGVRMEFFNGLVVNIELVPKLWNEEYQTEIWWNENYMKFDFMEKKLFYASSDGVKKTEKPELFSHYQRMEKELHEFESIILTPNLIRENRIENHLHPIFLHQFIQEKIKRTSIIC